MRTKIKERIVIVGRKVGAPLAPVTRIAHQLEHPVHLVYFLAIFNHWQYPTIALVCFCIGCLSLVPVAKKKD